MQRHAGEGETIAEAIRDCLDYGKNPEKTESGKYISAYECDPATVADEFLLAKASYAAMTGREQKKANDVLCYQIRQSFYPGEITPKEANRIGYELAMRWTKGRHAFIVTTHTDRQHMLQIEKVSKTYHSKGIDYPVLKEITATIHDGEFVAIMGPSGSGKTTLLNVISGFISADGGKVILDGQDILTGEENELAEIRQHKLGFVFQDFMLLNGLTIRENIFLPQIIAGKPKSQMEQNTHTLLEVFGIEEIAEKYPAEVSGGQKQRASIARALSNNPSIILADEPTGNLDSKSSTAVIEAFLNAKEKIGATIFMVTHDAFAASYADKVIALKDGIVFGELVRHGQPRDFLDELLDFTRKVNGDGYDA